jgi:serine/threonine-protein kinase RsbW
MPHRAFAFSIDSDLAFVARLAAQLRAACAELGVAEVDATAAEICVVEAANNAIEHAYGGRPGSRVEVTLALAGDELSIEIRDTGVPLPRGRLDEAQSVEHPLHDPDALPERGMGLAILKEAMDDVSCASAGGVNTLTLCRRVALSPQFR